MTNKLKSITLAKDGGKFQVIGTYTVQGVVMQGDEREVLTIVLAEDESFFYARTEAIKLAAANNVPFIDLVSAELDVLLAKMRKA